MAKKTVARLSSETLKSNLFKAVADKESAKIAKGM